MVGMSKKAMAAALSAMIGLTSAAALPVTAMADESGYTAKELQVAIWDNNQLAGLQQIADEWSENSRMYSGCTSMKRRSIWKPRCS